MITESKNKEMNKFKETLATDVAKHLEHINKKFDLVNQSNYQEIVRKGIITEFFSDSIMTKTSYVAFST